MDDVIEDELESEETSKVIAPFSLDLSKEDEETNPIVKGDY